MKKPYDRSYLDFVVEEQGRLFESLQDARPELDSADFIVSYLKSSTRRQLDEGHAYYLTKDAPLYARYQWETGFPSADVVAKVPLKWLVSAYPCA